MLGQMTSRCRCYLCLCPPKASRLEVCCNFCFVTIEFHWTKKKAKVGGKLKKV